MLIGNFYLDFPTSLPSLTMTSVYYIIFIFIAFVLSRTYRSFLRPVVLLIANAIFLFSFSINNLIAAFLLSLFGYFFAFIVERKKNDKIVYLGIFLYVIILAFFKYHGIFNINNIIMPLGISFYSFKIMSYLFDVNRGECALEKNIIYYFDYVTFFPTIIAGPINRAKPFFDTIKSKQEFDYKDSKGGAFQMLLGMFEKIVFCDYLALIVNLIFETETLYGLNMLLGIVLYSFQIYLDFDALSNIAIGSAKLLGFTIPKNFDSPYLASNLQEFWHRWHISLSTWFKDYLYIPLGGSHKGLKRKYINIIIVFVVSGLWHGSTLNFLIWGLLHGIIQVMEDIIIRNNKNKEFNKPIKYIGHFLGVIFNFAIVSIFWLVFKCQTISEVQIILMRLFTAQNFDYVLIGLTRNEFWWMIIVVAVTIIMDILRSKMDMIKKFNSWFFVFRWTIYIILIILFLVFGVYGGNFDSGDFIYQFF